jgi:hypothetical protein
MDKKTMQNSSYVNWSQDVIHKHSIKLEIFLICICFVTGKRKLFN